MNKSDRVLILFYRLLKGERIRKSSFMEEFSVGRRSFDRYIAAVRLMLSETFAPHELCYDADANEYYLTGLKQTEFRGLHILPLLLLLLESHVLNMGDTLEIMERLLAALPQREQQTLGSVIREAGKEYESAVTNSLLKLIWDLNFAISHHWKIRLWYGEDSTPLHARTTVPMRLTYMEHQFVLEALDEEGNSSTAHIYPLSTIRSFELATT